MVLDEGLEFLYSGQRDLQPPLFHRIQLAEPDVVIRLAAFANILDLALQA